MEVDLRAGKSPQRIAVLERRSLTFLLDPLLSKVHILDGQYGHTGLTHCLDASTWPKVASREQQRGSCAPGRVEVHRGFVQTRGQPVGIAVDEDALEVSIVDSLGWLYGVSADVLQSNPWDYLRRDDGVVLSVLPPDGFLHAVRFEEQIWLAGDNKVLVYELDGTLVSEETLGAKVVGMVESDGRMWVATERSAAVAGQRFEMSSPLGGIASDGFGGVWLSLPEEEALVHMAQGQEFERVEVFDITGPVSVDVASGRAYAITDDGVALVAEGELYGEYRVGRVRDLWVRPTHEILILTDENLLDVRFDEESLLGNQPPLGVFTTSFLEQPRSSSDDVGCSEGSLTLERLIQRSLRNRELITDLPGSLALGITPHYARRTLQCGMDEVARPAWEGDRIEPGVLYHQLPAEDCSEEEGCYDQFIEDQWESVEALGITPLFASGMSSHADVGLDWIAGLARTGVSQRYLFFGASVLPQIGHDGDPRSKQPWPQDTQELSQVFGADSLNSFLERDLDGAVTFYPGDSRAAFSLAGCAGLLVRECHAVGLGGGQQLDFRDTRVLDVLLHRALAVRSMDVPSTWSFHLPDVNTYDYTVRCTREEGVWSGGECTGGALQEWLFDVHARFVLSDIVNWQLPSQVAQPD